VIGKGFHRTDNEFLVYLAFTFPHSVYLAYRYPHCQRQFAQVFVVGIKEFKNSRSHYQGGTPVKTDGKIIAINMPVVNSFLHRFHLHVVGTIYLSLKEIKGVST